MFSEEDEEDDNDELPDISDRSDEDDDEKILQDLKTSTSSASKSKPMPKSVKIRNGASNYNLQRSKINSSTHSSLLDVGASR